MRDFSIEDDLEKELKKLPKKDRVIFCDLDSHDSIYQ